MEKDLLQLLFGTHPEKWALVIPITILVLFIGMAVAEFLAFLVEKAKDLLHSLSINKRGKK